MSETSCLTAARTVDTPTRRQFHGFRRIDATRDPDSMRDTADRGTGSADRFAADIVIIPAYCTAALRCDMTRNMLIPQPDRKKANIDSVIRRNRTAN